MAVIRSSTSVSYCQITRCSNIRFQWPEMSIPSNSRCSCSRVRSGSTFDISDLHSMRAQQPSGQLREARDDLVELLGHPHPGDRVEVDAVDAGQVDVDPEGLAAEAGEADAAAGLVDEGDGLADPEVGPACAGRLQLELLHGHQWEGAGAQLRVPHPARPEPVPVRIVEVEDLARDVPAKGRLEGGQSAVETVDPGPDLTVPVQEVTQLGDQDVLADAADHGVGAAAGGEDRAEQPAQALRADSGQRLRPEDRLEVGRLHLELPRDGLQLRRLDHLQRLAHELLG